jgi:predicted PurR-regulated permease PerM
MEELFSSSNTNRLQMNYEQEQGNEKFTDTSIPGIKDTAAKERKEQQKSFARKVWLTVGIVMIAVSLFWFLKATFNVMLLVLAGVLIALYFHGLSGLLQRKFRMKEKPALITSIIGTLILLVLFFWFAGDRIAQQGEELSETLPAAFEKVKGQLNDSPAGQKLIEQFSSSGNSGKIPSILQSFFTTTFGVLGDLYVIFFLGIFFTASPSTYTKGFIRLIPVKGRDKAEEVIDKLGSTLTKWIKGQLFSMFVVFALTAIGLAILGIPLWLVLALIAGLLSFIPNFGPLIALIPATLMGFLESPTKALLIVGLYMLVQALESNLITPQIQKKLINIPPALIILAQLFMGVLSGGWGLVLALPIVAVVMVVLEELYIKKMENSLEV